MEDGQQNVSETEKNVVVITGASSGIGRAAALAFARAGARLSLVARSEDALREVADECAEFGLRPLVHAVDVTVPGALADVCAKTAAAYDRVDVWVNGAAVLLLGRFEALPLEDFQRVLEVNVLGYAMGAKAALAQFRAQGGRGTLINVSSVLGVVPEPYASAYVASKFAVRGLTACLRQELRDSPGIHVCLLMPAAIDTPIYQHAGNHSGRAVRSILPVYAASRAAEAIVRLAHRPKKEKVVGGFGHLLMIGVRLAPGLTEALTAYFAPKLQFQQGQMAPTGGNLRASLGPAVESGGWRAYWRERVFGRKA